jgi:hypothetical protein
MRRAHVDLDALDWSGQDALGWTGTGTGHRQAGTGGHACGVGAVQAPWRRHTDRRRAISQRAGRCPLARSGAGERRASSTSSFSSTSGTTGWASDRLLRLLSRSQRAGRRRRQRRQQ